MYDREREQQPKKQVQSNGDHIEDQGSNDVMMPPGFAFQQDSKPPSNVKHAKKSGGDSLMAALSEDEQVQDNANAKGGSAGKGYSLGTEFGSFMGEAFGPEVESMGMTIGGAIGKGIGSILGGLGSLFGKKKGKKEKAKTGEFDTSAFKDKKRKVKTLVRSYDKAAVMVNNAIPKAEKKHKHYQKYMDAGLVDTGATTTRANHVKDGFKKVKKHIEEDKTVMKKWDLPKDHKFKERKTYGYVKSDDKDVNIYLGKMYWKASMTGRDSKAGTIVHELTHRIHGTSDHGYGIKNTLKFAKEDPAKATTNADNYEHFAEDA